MKINEIFMSLEGEGLRAGMPCIFIRRSGCNLCCKFDGENCDTPFRDEGVEMSVEEIMEKVHSYPCHRITLTGGEPLLPHKDLFKLRKALCDEDYEVNIETNGTMDTSSRFSNEFFTVDYKCNCSGETSKMNLKAFKDLSNLDAIKLVVSEEDFEQARQVISYLQDRVLKTSPRIYLSPCYGRCNLEKLADFVKDLSTKRGNIGVSLQLHKIIWSPDRRGV